MEGGLVLNHHFILRTRLCCSKKHGSNTLFQKPTLSGKCDCL